MPFAVRNRFLAVVATALIGVIAVALVRRRIDLEAAAVRAAVLVVAVVLVDRLVMPWVSLLLGDRPTVPTVDPGAATSPTDR